jgi:hypothetical protein
MVDASHNIKVASLRTQKSLSFRILRASEECPPPLTFTDSLNKRSRELLFEKAESDG